MIHGEYLCETCRKSCSYSDENDFICPDHGFVNAIREDGAVVRGDGHIGPHRIMAVSHEEKLLAVLTRIAVALEARK